MSSPIVKYQNFILRQFNGNSINFPADTIKVMLTTVTYTPTVVTDIFKSSVTNEVTGTNYTARGATVGAIAASETAGTLSVSGNSVTWAQSATGFSNARYAVLYKDTGVDGTSPLIGYIDLVSSQGNVAGDLIINWSSTATNGVVFTAT